MINSFIKKIHKKQIIIAAVIVCLLAGFILIKGCKKKSSGMVIREINPVYGNIETIISTTGTVQPQNRLEVKPAINGRIEEILVKEGDKVKTGDILAWMSSKERAALLDAARTEGAGKLDYWKQAYKATPLIAPINGEVIVRGVEPGQTVTSSDAVIVLSDRLIVKANVDETDIGKVKVGQPALVNLDAYSQTRVKAAVDHIAYESKTVSNVTIYEVDILPAKVPPLFRSGMSANVDIIDNKKEKVLLIPLEAVIRKDNKDFVSLVKKNSRKAVEHPVELGLSNGISVEVVSGLTTEDKIKVFTQEYKFSKETKMKKNPFMPFGRKSSKDKKKK